MGKIIDYGGSSYYSEGKGFVCDSNKVVPPNKCERWLILPMKTIDISPINHRVLDL
jgi:hypothetical protein